MVLGSLRKLPVVVVLVVGLVAAAAHGAAAGAALGPVITIGASLTTQPQGANRAITGLGLKRGLEMFIDWANTVQGGIAVGSTNYTFALKILEDNSNITTMLDNYRQLVADPSVNLLVGPVASDFSIAAASEVTEPASRLLIAGNAATDDFFKLHEKAFSMSPASSGFAQPALLEMRVVGAKTISLVTSDSPVHISTCGSVPNVAAGYQVKVASFQWIVESNTVLIESQKPNLTQTVENLIATNADAVLLCTYPPQVKFIIDTMKSKNYFPKLLIVNNLFSVNFDDYENREYVAGLTQWDLSARFPPDQYFGSRDNLFSQWQARYHEAISSPGAHGLYTGVVIYEIIKKASSLDEAALIFQLSRLDINTLKGRLAWTGDHAQLGTSILVQYSNGTLRTVGPVLAATERLQYPSPGWAERVADSSTFSKPADYGMTVIQIFGVVTNIGFFIFLVIHWTHPVIRAASPLFLSIVLVGSSLLYVQPWTVMPDVVTGAACHLRHWILALGFSLTFGALFAKSWRVWRLYSNSGVHIFKISDTQLGAVVAVLVVVELIICVLISSVGQPAPIKVVVDPLRPFYDYYICSTSTTWNVFVGILGGYNLLIIIVGIYLSVRIRVIPMSVYNESKILGFAIYNVSFFSVLITVIYASAIADRFTVYAICTSFQVVGTLLTTSMIFFSKIALLKSKLGSMSSAGSSGMRGSGARPQMDRISSTSGTEYTMLKTKYRLAKMEIRELREKLGLDLKAPYKPPKSYRSGNVEVDTKHSTHPGSTFGKGSAIESSTSSSSSLSDSADSSE